MAADHELNIPIFAFFQNRPAVYAFCLVNSMPEMPKINCLIYELQKSQ